MKYITFLLVLTIAIPGFGQSLYSRLYNDIEDGRLDEFSLAEAACIISGQTTKDSLQVYIKWYQNIVKGIESLGFVDPFDKPGSAEKLFYYLHTHFLKEYQEKATTFVEIKNQRHYNCVSGTVLYNLICDELGLNTEAFETPTHVYTIFSNFSKNVVVENTSSMGFNITKNLKSYSKTL